MAAYFLRVFEPITGRSSSFRWNKGIGDCLKTARHPVAIPEVRYWHKNVLRWHSTTTRLPFPRPNHPSILCFNSPLNLQTRLIPVSTPAWRRYSSDHHGKWQSSNRQTFTYVAAVAIAVVGLSYAAVPLYRLYCQASGYGGTVSKVDAGVKIEQMVPVEERELTIRFSANRNSSMRWTFKPQQTEIKLVPGETALAFYTATNPTDEPITGIATYNVIPFDAGQYFNKIQCFCFEEQRLNPHEEVDMPVFFYIDPEFDEDPLMARVDTITLSYTFFEAKDGENIDLPVPEFMKQ